MDKDVTVNHKKGHKKPRIKKKQPLKVVYISNPIKFKTSASEFRSLVQELTGQDSDPPESSTKSVADGCSGGSGGGGQPEKAVHAPEDVSKIGQHNDIIPPSIWSFGDETYSPQMVEEFQGLDVDLNLIQEASDFDVLRRLDSM